jgi:outer membrane protein TolC
MKKVIVLILCIIYTVERKAQNHSVRLTLKECLEYAVESNRSLINARLESRETAAKTKEVRSTILPQVNALASLTDNLAIPVVMLAGRNHRAARRNDSRRAGVPYEAGVSAQLSQVIFNPALFTGIKAARSAGELMKLKEEMTEEQLIYDVASGVL